MPAPYSSLLAAAAPAAGAGAATAVKRAGMPCLGRASGKSAQGSSGSCSCRVCPRNITAKSTFISAIASSQPMQSLQGDRAGGRPSGQGGG